MPIRKLTRLAARTRKKKSAPGKKHVGDVLGLGPAKPPRRPLKKSTKPRRPKGIEVIARKRPGARLRPARVRG